MRQQLLSLCSRAWEPRLLSPCAATTEACMPKMAGWHHRLDGHEFEWTPGDGDGQGGLVCCDSWGHKESDTTERLIWSDLTSVFSKTSCTSGSYQLTYCWSLAWKILSIIFLDCKTVQEFEHSLALPFFGIGMKTDLFQSWGHCWLFQICWHIKCSTWTASSFRIWNSSAGIPSPPLALLVVIFLRPTWLLTPGCVALGEWSHQHGYPGH